MVELTKVERRLSSFPTRKISEEEAIRDIKKAVSLIQIAWEEVEDAQYDFNRAVEDNTYTLRDIERVLKATEWLRSATKRYYMQKDGLDIIKQACYESEIPKSAVEKYWKGV